MGTAERRWSLLGPWPEHWPLTVLFVGYPLWWALGLSALMPVLMAVPMALQLLRRHPIRVPVGFVPWLVFLLWMSAGVVMLFVDAPGAVPGGGASRLIVFGYRFLWYLSITIVLLWVINSTERAVPTQRVVRLMGWMFVVTVVGGLFGLLVPTFEFTSLVEAVLPGPLRSNNFIRSLAHPATASIQSVLGVSAPRPIAPFSFANAWGANLSMFLPFFLVGWLGRDAGWRRSVAPIVLLLAAVPIVMSLNRGLWGSLAIGIVYFILRLVLTGRMVALVGAVLCVLVAGTLFVVSPLGELSVSRLENPHSNERRGQLLTDTVVSTAKGSPVLGFGSTRDVQGSFASIAGGGTPDCPGCEVPPLGTQGQLWLVIFSQGFVGTVAFLSFFGAQMARHWRSRTTIEVVGVCLLLFSFLQLFVYDTLGLPTYTLMVAIGLMERERFAAGASGQTLESIVALLRRYRAMLAALFLIGAVLGAGVALQREPTYTATVSVLLAPAPVYLDPSSSTEPKQITVDTEASMVYSERTVEQVMAELDLTDSEALRDSVRVTAPANSRVLDITVRGTDADRATEVADGMAAAYLAVRADYLEQRRDQLRQQLSRQLELAAGTGELTEADEQTAAAPTLAEDELREQLESVELLSTEAGEVLRPATARRARSQAEVPIASGAMLGLLAGFLIISFREAGIRQRRSRPAAPRDRVPA